jgi:glycosyltransferase involved in cell wall biosynthesis
MRILGVMDEDPFDPLTWSGSSRYLFNTLKEQGALAGAVSAEPSSIRKRILQLAHYHPNVAKWKLRYRLSTGLRDAMTQAARARMSAYRDSDFDVVLQVGAWYDMPSTCRKPVVSYHDGNFARYIAGGANLPAISRARIERVRNYEHRLYSKLRVLFPMSSWLADSFMKDFGVPASRLFPVYAGINLDRIAHVPDREYNARRILFVGKDFARKGGHVLLEAFKIVRRQLPDAELTIIGPKLAEDIPGVRALGFISKASAAGQERLLEEYVRADVFVMPSLYEPFGIVFAEAMAHRLPCVGTTSCAMPEIIAEGVTGFTVPPGDAPALADRLLTLLRDPALCRSMGEQGYQRYLEHFNWPTVCRKMREILATELRT